jgi:ubiquinone/menaquinone biosynthesis C-methylase UbiE
MENKPADQDKCLYFLDYAPAYRMKLIKELIGPVNGKTVADIGCGKGSISYLLWTLGAKVWSFDISLNELRVTRSLKGSQNLNSRFDPIICQCDARQLPIIEETFDLVLCLETLEHLRNDGDRTAIREIERVAKQGAKIILSVPYTKKTAQNEQNQRYRHYSSKTIKIRLIPEPLQLEQALYWYFPILSLLDRLGLRYIIASIGSMLLFTNKEKPNLKSKYGFTQSLMAFYDTTLWRRLALPVILIILKLNKPFEKLPYSNDVFLILKK